MPTVTTSVLRWYVLVAIVAACDGGSGAGIDNPSPAITSISISAGTTTLGMGRTGWQLTASASDGSNLNATSGVTWISSNSSVLTVSGGGIVTTLTPGQSTVSATYQGKTGSIVLTVTPDVAAVTISGGVGLSYSSASTTPQTTQVGAAATVAEFYGCTGGIISYNDRFGETSCNVTSLATWSSSNPAVITVSNGLLTAVGAGQANITATYHTVASSLPVTVSSTPLNLSGNWSGTQTGSQSPNPMTLNLIQTGTTLSGSATVQYPFISGFGSITSSISGTVTGATVTLNPMNNLGGCFSMTIRLTVTSATNSRMAGGWAKTGNCDDTSAGGAFVITK